MSIRFSRLAIGVLAIAAVALMSAHCWAVYYELPPSKDEWGLKYDVAVSNSDSDRATVAFTLADEGRLKPIYSITVVAFSEPEHDGGRSYKVKAPLELKKTADGKRVGQVQIPKEFADRSMIRILTLTVSGKRHTSAAYLDIPLKKYMNKASAASAQAPRSKTTK